MVNEVDSVALKMIDKKAIVAEVADVARKAQSAIAAEYRGLTVAQLTDLRVKAKDKVFVKVVRNTLAKLAVKDTEFSCMEETLIGPVILLFSLEDPGEVARLVRDFSKENEKFNVKAIVLGGKLLDPKKLRELAELPTKEQAIAQLMSVMIAPITKLVRTFVEPQAMLVRTVAAIRDQKQAA